MIMENSSKLKAEQICVAAMEEKGTICSTMTASWTFLLKKQWPWKNDIDKKQKPFEKIEDDKRNYLSLV